MAGLQVAHVGDAHRDHVPRASDERYRGDQAAAQGPAEDADGVDLGAEGREAEERAGPAHGRDAQETPADGCAAPCPLVVSELVAARERFPAHGVFARFGVRHRIRAVGATHARSAAHGARVVLRL